MPSICDCHLIWCGAAYGWLPEPCPFYQQVSLHFSNIFNFAQHPSALLFKKLNMLHQTNSLGKVWTMEQSFGMNATLAMRDQASQPCCVNQMERGHQVYQTAQERGVTTLLRLKMELSRTRTNPTTTRTGQLSGATRGSDWLGQTSFPVERIKSLPTSPSVLISMSVQILNVTSLQLNV